MSFTQRYKKDITDLLKKNKTLDNKRIKKIKIIKNNFNSIKNNNSFLSIVNLKHYFKQKTFKKNKLATPNNHSENSKMNSLVPIFSNKRIKSKIDKETNTIKEYNIKLIPIHKPKLNKNKNAFSYDKIKFNNTYNKIFLKRINDEIKNDIDTNTKNVLSKNDSKFKLSNKLERLNFYRKIQKAYDEITMIKRKNFIFDKSLFLFSPINKKNQNNNNKKIKIMFLQKNNDHS